MHHHHHHHQVTLLTRISQTLSLYIYIYMYVCIYIHVINYLTSPPQAEYDKCQFSSEIQLVCMQSFPSPRQVVLKS